MNPAPAAPAFLYSFRDLAACLDAGRGRARQFQFQGDTMARVLVVDDSPTDVLNLRKMLEKHGHQVSEALTGQDAIGLVAEQKPDVVVMDVVMPGLNGFQATRTLSKNPDTAGIPVIVVSSKGQETDKLWAKRQGAREYIVKPVKEPELINKIEAVLKG